MQAEIFISYSWKEESNQIADELEAILTEKKMNIIRDVRALGYKGLIKPFMQKIGKGKYVILIISDAYLKSENCMFELIQVYKSGKFHGDPHFENCFLKEKTNVLTFFDFDFCGKGYLLYDLGSFFHYEKDSDLNKKNFLDGYSNVRALKEDEIAIIPYFEILMRLFHLGARAINADGIKNPLWKVFQIEKTIQLIHDQTMALD